MAKFDKINKNIQTKQDKLDKLQAELEQLKQQKIQKAGEIVAVSGLLDVDISDKELLEELKKIVARFQKTETKPQPSIQKAS